MARYFEAIYRFADALARTAARFNTNWEHIDARLDVNEAHIANLLNPHGVTSTTTASSPATHTHTVGESFAWYYPGSLQAVEIGPRLKTKVAGTITDVWATLKGATAGDTTAVDIQKSGDYGVTWATIFSTRVSIDANEYDSDIGAIPAVLSVTAVSANDQFKAIIIGGSGAEGLTVGFRMELSVSQD